MKTILICRHSKAGASSPSGRDHDRDLSNRGRTDSQGIGRELSRRGFAPEVVLASDSVRTRQTTKLILPQLESSPEVFFLPELYSTTASGILDVVATHGLDATTVLVVCHNPAAEEVVSRAAGHPVHMKTSMVGVLEVGAAVATEFAPLAGLTLKEVFGPPAE